MYRKDQIKGIVAIILFASIGISYALFDKEIAKIVAVIGLVIWLSTMYILNKKKK